MSYWDNYDANNNASTETDAFTFEEGYDAAPLDLGSNPRAELTTNVTIVDVTKNSTFVTATMTGMNGRTPFVHYQDFKIVDRSNRSRKAVEDFASFTKACKAKTARTENGGVKTILSSMKGAEIEVTFIHRDGLVNGVPIIVPLDGFKYRTVGTTKKKTRGRKAKTPAPTEEDVDSVE